MSFGEHISGQDVFRWMNSTVNTILIVALLDSFRPQDSALGNLGLRVAFKLRLSVI